MLRRDKQKELETISCELEKSLKKGNSRPVYQAVKNLTKQFCPYTMVIKDENGKKITEPEKSQRWKEYCGDLYNDIEEEDINIKIIEKEPPPSKDKISHAILKLSNQNAAGPDEISIILLRYSGEMTLNKLHEIRTETWKTGTWPEEWKQSTFIPLHKKGDPFRCSNYRTIALVNHASKILLQVILERMQKKI